MISDFFQIGAFPGNQLKGSYDFALVVLSFMVAIFASYIALDMTGRLRDINNTLISRSLWLIGGSIAMGAGIWSMHFIGMLSFTIPGLSLRYDVFWTVLSLGVAIFASFFALFLLQAGSIRVEHYIAGGIILGIAIASMHYTGMEAMLITLNIRYLPALFFLSVLIAIVASEAALWLSLKSTQVVLKIRNRIKLASAIIMGIAICGMHYTGMAASIFTPLCAPTLSSGPAPLDPTLLAIGVAGITFVILSMAFFASSYKESLNQQQFERARQLGMAELSASVLHNVGNILNSVRVSADIITEKTDSSKLIGLEKLATLFKENEQDLATFLTKDPRGEQAGNFLYKLTDYWRDEQRTISEELARLNKNIDLIKKSITMQQDLSKEIFLEQVISVEELLDEALIVTGIPFKRDIIVEKNYSKVENFIVDKVKLLQAVVNLLNNAKDAVIESNNEPKIISIKTSVLKNNILHIEITDTGVGIHPKNINKIFNYGFTTKQSGHGFGLHTSALSINSLGGKIKVKSEGLTKGTTFIIELPYKKYS